MTGYRRQHEVSDDGPQPQTSAFSAPSIGLRESQRVFRLAKASCHEQGQKVLTAFLSTLFSIMLCDIHHFYFAFGQADENGPIFSVYSERVDQAMLGF